MCGQLLRDCCLHHSPGSWCLCEGKCILLYSSQRFKYKEITIKSFVACSDKSYRVSVLKGKIQPSAPAADIAWSYKNLNKNVFSYYYLSWQDDHWRSFFFFFSSSHFYKSVCSRSVSTSAPVQSVPGQVAAPTLWMCGKRPQSWTVGRWVWCLWRWNRQLFAPAQVESSPTSPAPHIPETPASTAECVWTLSMATGEFKVTGEGCMTWWPAGARCWPVFTDICVV